MRIWSKHRKTKIDKEAPHPKEGAPNSGIEDTEESERTGRSQGWHEPRVSLEKCLMNSESALWPGGQGGILWGSQKQLQRDGKQPWVQRSQGFVLLPPAADGGCSVNCRMNKFVV